MEIKAVCGFNGRFCGGLGDDAAQTAPGRTACMAVGKPHGVERFVRGLSSHAAERFFHVTERFCSLENFTEPLAPQKRKRSVNNPGLKKLAAAALTG